MSSLVRQSTKDNEHCCSYILVVEVMRVLVLELGNTPLGMSDT
jgi:hypothetical protein